MSVGQISGPLLSKNLLRNGVDLSFETDLLYLDVNTLKVGVRNQYLSSEFEANQNFKIIDLIVDNTSTIGSLEISGNTIARSTGLGDINLNAVSAIIADNIATDTILINDQKISITTNNTDLELRPTQFLQVRSNAFVNGGVHVTDNITFDGTITFGNSTSDTIAFNSDINSDLIPTTDLGNKLGTSLKTWKNAWATTIHSDIAEAGLLITDANISYNVRTGNTYYVATNGLDSNQGNHPNSPFATIKHALSLCTSGFTVYIYPGTYYEDFPLTVPSGVSVTGAGIRSVNIKPTTTTNYKDCFLLNNQTTISHLTISDFYGDDVGDTGYAFRFADGLNVQSRSPYIQNVTVISNTTLPTSIPETPSSIYVDPVGLGLQFEPGTVTITKADHPESLVQSWIGETMIAWFNDVAFYVVTGYNDNYDPNYWTLEFDTPFNFDNQGWGFSIYPVLLQPAIIGSEGYQIVNDNWMSFRKTSLPPFFATTVGPGWTLEMLGSLNSIVSVGQDPDSPSRWRIYFDAPASTGLGVPIFSISASSPSVTYRVGKGALVDGSVADYASKEASMLFHSCTFITPNADCITMLNGVRVEWLNSFTYYANRGLYALDGNIGRAYLTTSPQIGPVLFAISGGGGPGPSLATQYGAEVRSIGSANVYGNYGAVADGPNTLMYLINHNFAYIGAGTSSINDPTVTIRENETLELNSGKIYYTSINEIGDFKVGDVFYIDNATGTANINPSLTTIQAQGYVNLTNGTDSVFIDATKLHPGDIEISGHTIKTLSQTLNFNSATDQINFQNNTTINGNVGISNDLRVDGTLTLGNQTTDTITFNTRITQDLKPKITNSYDLGSSSFNWKTAYAVNMLLPQLSISSNEISSVSNQDLLMSGNGSGIVNVEGIVFNNKTINTSADLTLSPAETLAINKSNALLLPVGSTVDRTVLSDGELRFNTTTGHFQGNNVNFGGIISTDSLTSLKAHPTNNTFDFRINGSSTAALDSDAMTVPKFLTGQITINSNKINTNNDDLLVANGPTSYGVIIQGIKLQSSQIINQTNDPIILTSTGDGYIKIAGTNAVVIPSGTDLQRQNPAETGQFRYNTSTPELEVYDGITWRPAVGTDGVVSQSEVEEINFLYNLVLG